LLRHYIATTSKDGLQIHQYIASEMAIDFEDGGSAKVLIETSYPWEGAVKLVISETDQHPWELALRIPAWCEEASVQIGDDVVNVSSTIGKYARLKRTWLPGDFVQLNLSLTPRFIEPNPRIDALRSSLAVAMGPLVYCFEGLDQPAEGDLSDLRIDPGKPLEAAWREDLLGGVMEIRAQGALMEMSGWQDNLYRSMTADKPSYQDLTLKAIPYYAWANRGPETMRVWIARR